MGGCVGTSRQSSIFNNFSHNFVRDVRHTRAAENADFRRLTTGTSVGKNVPLRHERIRWKSDLPLAREQVVFKREEFWDTAPSYDGRREIWDALKAAATAVEIQDYDLAQAIVDGANIMLPNGILTDCYDELGTRYQLPVYCLSLPLNMIPVSSGQASMTSDATVEGEEVTLKVRLSTTLKDVRLSLLTSDTVAIAKDKLQYQEDLGEYRQRWYYSGKMLSDTARIADCQITPGYIVQCILTELLMISGSS